MSLTKSCFERVALAVLVAGLSACAGNACEKPQPYQTATERSGLRVPEDLHAPEASGKYDVPEAGAGKPVRGPCGDTPPLRKAQAQAEARAPAAPSGAALTALPPSIEPTADPDLEREVRQIVSDWVASWREADADRYLAHYSASFQPPVTGEPLALWQAKRRELLAATGPTDVRFDRLRISGDAQAPTARFIQEFHKDGQINAVVKELELVREDGVLKIARERVAEVL